LSINNPWLLMIISISLLGFTGQKLFKMTQIRGWVSGTTVIEKIITDKQSNPSENSFWLSWDGQNADKVGLNRTNIPKSLWLTYQVGDSLQLVKVPRSDRFYLQDGIYAANENFVFDIILFIGEITLLIYSVLLFMKRVSLKKTLPSQA